MEILEPSIPFLEFSLLCKAFSLHGNLRGEVTLQYYELWISFHSNIQLTLPKA